MNDYIFTIEVSDKDGSNVRQENVAVCDVNVEVAYDKVISKVDYKSIVRELISVKKL